LCGVGEAVLSGLRSEEAETGDTGLPALCHQFDSLRGAIGASNH